MATHFATIYRADSALARCVKCGVQRQFHGLAPKPINAWDRLRDHEFEAETIDDIDPADMKNADLIRAVKLATSDIDAIDRLADPDNDENDLHSRQWNRRKACLAEIAARNRAVFGLRWDDFKAMMEDL